MSPAPIALRDLQDRKNKDVHVTTHKFFNQPQFHDEAFYRDREVADHINQPGHRERLLRTLYDILYLLDVDLEATTVGDFGCGNGGMLHELKKRRPDITSWGYDLSPKAVTHAKEVYGVNATLLDFTKDQVKLPTIAVMTETLEHLVDPEAFLRKLKDGKVKWLVISVPLEEDDHNHYEFHLWAWDRASFAEMFTRLGYTVITHYHVQLADCQHLIALNGLALPESAP